MTGYRVGMRQVIVLTAAGLFLLSTLGTAIADPLTDAVKASDADAAARLLRKGADPNVRDRWGHETPLIDAISAGNAKLTTLLLTHGADSNYTNIDGKTPLMAAAGYGDIGLVRQLLKAGAKVDAVESHHLPPELARDVSGKTVLMWAAESRNPNVVALLLGKGADPNARDSNGDNVLVHAAASSGAVYLLLKHGAKLDKTRDSYAVLSSAARAHNSASVSMFLKAGADPNAADEVGFTPLMDAAMDDQTAIIVQLMDHGAHVDSRDHGGDTALTLAAYHGAVNAIDYLHDHGASLETRNDRGETPLITAAQEDQPAAITRLVKRGAKVDGIDNAGATALFHAALQSHPNSVRTLLDLGADANASTRFGMSVLAAAVESDGGVEMVNLLISHGANVDAADTDGVTPLMRARQRGKADVVKLLEAHGRK